MLQSHDLNVVIVALGRLRDRLYRVESATRRKRTPGRVAAIERDDDLSGWDWTDLESWTTVGLPLETVVDRVRTRVDWLLEHWSENSR